MEAQKLCMMYSSTRANRRCCFCEVIPGKESMMVVGEPRELEKMKRIIVSHPHLAQEYSLQPEHNKLWNVPGLDVFRIPPCRMHATDHGVFVLLFQLTMKWLHNHRATQQFDDRWQHAGVYLRLKVFKRGVSNMSFVMAHEHRAMAIMLNGIEDNTDDSAQRVAWLYLRWRSLLSLPYFTEGSLQLLKELTDNTQKANDELHVQVENEHVGLSIKFHMMRHWADSIREFGCPSNFDSETWESAHKVFVKPYVGHLGHNAARPLLTRDIAQCPELEPTTLTRERANGKLRSHPGQ
eukprot:c23073_g1_i1.p1 GENE.c23073_g1_i1~~c23073_g1_i1.p1  ORF type:complete len:294 (+),score=54.77 c23073_g1_i1:1225-2106(+)